jgi:ketosteroid isomerase-like protein
MIEHPNATLVRDLVDGMRCGDLTGFDAVASPDLVWHFPGRHGKLAGAHRGREEIMDFLAKVVDMSDGTFDLDPIDVVANDRRAVLLFHGRASRGGRRLDNPTCLSILFRDRQVAEVWEFVWDLYDVEEFWS